MNAFQHDDDLMKNRNILISGAGVAGLSLAFWLQRYGFNPTVIERAPALRDGGYKVDIRGSALEVVENMGILSRIREATTGMRGASFVDRDGRQLAAMDADLFGGRSSGDVEIMRGDLVHILYNTIRYNVEHIFGDSITSLTQCENGVDVTFLHNSPRTFDLVIGTDGLHSSVRALAFGDESRFVRHLGHYLAIFTLPNYLRLDRWELLYAAPGRTVNVYSTRTDAAAKAYFIFTAPRLEYDHQDNGQQKLLVTRAFAGGGWEIPYLLRKMTEAPDFYFDAISQVHMERWSNGRVALLGDAGYCASPASGQGTSLALVGAYVLAGELALSAGNHTPAFTEYEMTMRNFVGLNQDLATANLKGMVLQSKAQIWFQTQMIRLLPHLPGKDRMIGRVVDAMHHAATAIKIRNYPMDVNAFLRGKRPLHGEAMVD